MAHVDLHLHLIPGVDDGAPDEAAALEHAARMVADGVHEATVTPHVGAPMFPLDPLTILERTAAMQTALDREGLALRLHPGGEIHPDRAADLTRRELDAIAHGRALGARRGAVRGRRRALHRRARGDPRARVRCADRASGARAGRARRGLSLLRDELERGAAFQVNVCSLLGRQGEEALEAAEWLVRAQLAYVLASDGHPGTGAREHTLGAGVAAAIAAGASPAYAGRLTGRNPGRLLAGTDPAPGGRDWRGHGALERVRQAQRRLARLR